MLNSNAPDLCAVAAQFMAHFDDPYARAFRVNAAVDADSIHALLIKPTNWRLERREAAPFDPDAWIYHLVPKLSPTDRAKLHFRGIDITMREGRLWRTEQI